MTVATNTVKIVVSMVVVAALVATRFSSSQSPMLKGGRNLQFGGIVVASSQGDSTAESSIKIGSALDNAAGTGNSFGDGDAVGTSNGFSTSPLGAASATGNSGGNSTAKSALTLVAAAGTLGEGLTTTQSEGGGGAGGNAVFGPSLAAAVAAATPVAAPAPVEAEESSGSGDKKNGGGNNPDPGVPAAPSAPQFSFQQGLPTGGGGGGNGAASGNTATTLTIPGALVEEAYGNSLANGFGFGVGSGVAVNNGGEQAGGQGGGTALGQGDLVFEIDEAFNSAFSNQGNVTSSGGAGAYVGFDPPAPLTFGNFITPPPSTTVP